VPVWLGQAPSGIGWRYMHEDGRTEDIDPAAMGLPEGWAPPGFESTVAPAPVPTNPADLAPEPSLGVAPLEVPGMPAPQPRAPATAAPQPQSQSVRSSFSGSTLPVDSMPSDRLSQRAAQSAASRMGGYNAYADADLKAAETESALLAQQAQAKQTGLVDQAFQLHNNADTHQKAALEIDARAREWTARIEQAMAEIPTVDSGKLFSDASTSQEAAIAISAAIGGFLQPVLGTNAPMDIINKAIDRSVNDQMAAQRAAQQNVQNLGQLASTDQEQMRWSLHEADISRLGHLTALERETDAKIQSYQSDIFRNNGAKFKADLLKEKNAVVQRMFEADRAFNQEQYKAETQRTHQSAMLAEAQRQTAAAEAKAGAGPELENIFDGKQYGIKFKQGTIDGDKHVINLGSKELAQQMNESAKKSAGVSASIDEVLQLLGEGGRRLPGNAGRERTKQALSRIMAYYVETGGRSFADNDAKIVQDAISSPDPMSILRLKDNDTIVKGLVDYQRDLKRRTQGEVNRFSSAFGEATVEFPRGKALIDPPDKRLNFAQALKALDGEVARGDKADPAKIAGYLDAFGDLHSEAALGGLVAEGAGESIQALGQAALTLPQVQDSPEMQQVIHDATAEAWSKVQSSRAVDASSGGVPVYDENNPPM
jgi:hypothetical protein